MSIVAGASALNIAIGLARTKMAALLLGPQGIGEIGLFFNLVQFAATLGALGLGTSAVRQIADARGRNDAVQTAAARRSLVWIGLALAIASGLIFCMCRDIIMRCMAVNVDTQDVFGWLALAVSLTILSIVPVTLLIGHRQVGEQAAVQVLGALIGTITGIAILAHWGDRGVVAYIVAAPASMLLAGMIVARRLPAIRQRWDRASVIHQAKAMIGLGLPLMVGAISVTGGMLALRSMLAYQFGPVGLGQFTAAWTLCVTYLGFIMQAMGTDYFPRLSAAIGDHSHAEHVVHEQMNATLLIALPIILLMEAGAPWLIPLLYSSKFEGAVDIVRWQIFGDVFKISAAPLAYVILACGRGKLYWLGETIAIVGIVGMTALLLPWLGLVATGVGYAIASALYLALVYFLARRLIGFRLAPGALRHIAVAWIMVGSVATLSVCWAPAGFVIGIALAGAAGLHTLRSLDLITALPSAVRSRLPQGLIRWIAYMAS